MKKLGTPIAAGPGSDSEKVGFDVVGTPLPVGSAGEGGWEERLGLALACLCLGRPLPVAPVLVVVWLLEDFCWRRPGLLWRGVVELLLVVVLELEELELELEVEVEVELLELELEELLELDEVELDEVLVGLAVVVAVVEEALG
jgi:hypothetical protein